MSRDGKPAADGPETRSIRRSVPIALIRAREAVMAHFRPLLAQRGYTEQQWRVLRVLEHFRARNNNSEAAGLLSTQSDIDANAVATSYSLIKVFIWAIPILGFIGTVYGLGSAVGSFGAGLDAVQDITVLKKSLNAITDTLLSARWPMLDLAAAAAPVDASDLEEWRKETKRIKKRRDAEREYHVAE